jgi:vitamin B12 transporter
MVFGLSTCFCSWAQTDSTVLPLDEVIITANRFPQKQQTTGKVVAIITRSEIEKSGSLGLGDLLNRQAGITIAGANNNLGTNQDMYMRGAATGNTLILLDGVPLYDVSTIANTFDLNHIPLDMIERIEILKGAQSTVYGSDAVAGVVHIITRKREEKPLTAFTSLSTGSFNTLDISAGLRGSYRKNEYQFQYRDIRSKGFSSAHDSSGKMEFDRDGFRQQVFSGRIQTRINSRLEWKLNGLRGRYATDLDKAAYIDEKDFTSNNQNLQAGTGLTYLHDRFSIHANYQFSELRRTYLDDSVFASGYSKYSKESYVGRSHFSEIYGKFKLREKLELLAGVDHRMQSTDQSFLSISSLGPFTSKLASDTARIGLSSVYASAFYQNGKGFHLEVGGRLNRHSRFGNHATFTLNPSFVLRERWKFFFNLSSAFKAPSLYQLYDAGVGERSLVPETSLTAEGGLQYHSPDRHWNARLVGFVRDISNGIDFNYVDFRYFNYNRQQAAGLEFELSYRKGKWSFDQNYAFVTGRVNTVNYSYDPGSYSYVPSGDTTYNNLFRRPKHSLNAALGYQADKHLFLRLGTRIVGMRYEPRFMDSPIELKPYQTIDLFAEYRIQKNWRIYADLGNLLDVRYFDIAGFNARRRNFMVGIKMTF